MKKTVFTFLVSAILISSWFIPVFAATPTFNFYCSFNSKDTGVAKTKEITFIFSVKDFNNFAGQTDGGQNGIDVLRATLDYDENVFEPIEINTTAEGIYNGIKTTTSDNIKAIVAKGNWTGLTYNPETKRMVVTAGRFINFSDEVVQITLKVKPTATLGETTVSLKDIEGSDQAKDIHPGNVSKTVTVIDAVNPDPIDPDPEHGFGGYLRILPDIKFSEFKLLYVDGTGKYKYGDLKNTQNSTLADTDYVPTGATTTANGLSYTVITVGDLNSDGRSTVTDLSQLKAYYVGSFTALNDNQKRACDLKWDGKFTVTDTAQLKFVLVGFRDADVKTCYVTTTPKCIPISR